MSNTNVFYVLYGIFLYLFFSSFITSAQVSLSRDSDRLSYFLSHRNLHFSNTLYLQTDKNIYTNNEIIWFSAYIFSDNIKESANHQILSIVLKSENAHEVTLTDKYLIQNDRSSGGLMLPDSIAPGEYTLYAYTNVLNDAGRPKALFTTRLTIKNTMQHGFYSSVKLLDSTVKNGVLRVKVQVLSNQENLRKQSKTVVEYRVGDGVRSTNAIKGNELIISIPVNELNVAKPILYVKITHNEESQVLESLLPSAQRRIIDLRFFPEGGFIAAGLPDNIGWECLDNQGEPIPTKAILLKDNIAVDTIYNSIDGMGTFRLQPELNCKYSIKIESGIYLAKDTVIALPKESSDLPSIQIIKAVCNDTLKLRIFSHNNPAVQLLLHNDAGEYCLFKIRNLQSGRLIMLPLDSVKKGVTTFTLLDQQGRPLAERLFFAHYDQTISAKIQTMKKSYGKRESVIVTVKLSDHAGNPVKGIFSIGVVQSNRMNSTFKNIEDEVYFNNFTISAMNFDGTYADKDYLEHMLLIHGWRKYTWPDDNDFKPDTGSTSASITAQVKQNGKLLKQPVTMAALSGKTIKLFTTGANGSVMLSTDILVTENDKKIAFLVTGKKNTGFTMKMSDQFQTINNMLASEAIHSNHNFYEDLSDSRKQLLNDPAFTYTLATVTIRANKSNGSFYESKNLGAPGTNDCGDFVDAAGELNYPYGKERYKPIKGKLYVHRTDYENHRFKVDPAWYSGCDVEENKSILLTIDGIYSTKEFYGVNLNSDDNQYISTLFWNPAVATNAQGVATVKFPAGDIQGNFTAQIEGTASNNVVSGKTSFVVQ